MKKSILILFVVLFSFACKKNQVGGNAQVEGIVKHHSKIIANASIFVKYNATEFPGADTTLYDTKVRADKDGKFTIDLYKGEYFIYGFGYDYAIPAPYHVVGGVPVKLRSKEKVNITLPITEGD